MKCDASGRTDLPCPSVMVAEHLVYSDLCVRRNPQLCNKEGHGNGSRGCWGNREAVGHPTLPAVTAFKRGLSVPLGWLMYAQTWRERALAGVWVELGAGAVRGLNAAVAGKTMAFQTRES